MSRPSPVKPLTGCICATVLDKDVSSNAQCVLKHGLKVQHKKSFMYITRIVFTVGSLDQYVGRSIGQQSVDSRSTTGQ